MRTNKLAELIGENGEILFSIISVVTVGETRRSSFGAPKLSLEELEEDGGLIDKALAFPVPSNIEMYNPFKVVTDPEDEHFQFEEDNAENVSDYCTMCSELLTEARKSLLAEKIKVVTKIQLMEKQEFSWCPSKGQMDPHHSNWWWNIVGVYHQG